MIGARGSVEGEVLHVTAERREEEKDEGRDYVRREFRYGALSRDLPLPKGVSDKDVKATYKDGLLDIRITMPKVRNESTQKIPVGRS